MHTTHDFGYVALDIQKLQKSDAATYKAVAKNKYGQATSTIKLEITPEDVQNTDPTVLNKLKALESKEPEMKQETVHSFQKPVFTVPLQNVVDCVENGTAHFEGRLIPVGDPDLVVSWTRNGVPVKFANRIKPTHDFGFVALDLCGVAGGIDDGVYVCHATNLCGEASTSAKLSMAGMWDGFFYLYS